MENNIIHLYLLVESGGDYSDQWSNNICFYDSLQKAEDIAAKANEIVRIYAEKHKDLYKGHVHPFSKDPDWREKIEAFSALAKAVDDELLNKLNELIGLENEAHWFRYDCHFSVENIPYL